MRASFSATLAFLALTLGSATIGLVAPCIELVSSPAVQQAQEAAQTNIAFRIKQHFCLRLQEADALHLCGIRKS